jgi:paxillin
VFFERDGKPYCETDFFEVYCPKCAACDKPIRGDCVNAIGQQWHQEHWGCTFCKKAFGSEPFFEIGGKPYCEQHYHQQSGALCQGCKKPIQGRCITALDKKWHPEHFTCAFCMNPLAGASYVEKQGKPYCKTCNAKLFS